MEDNKVMTESLVISALYNDITLINEYPIDNSFKNEKCKFYYDLIKELSKVYREINEITVSNYVSQSKSLSKTYELYGGWKSIENVKKLGSELNFDAYVDSLFKIRLIESLEDRGFNIKKKIKIDGEEVKPIDLFVNFSCEQVHQFYELLLNDASVHTNSTDIVVEELYYTDDEIKKKIEGEDDYTTPFDVTMTYDYEGKEKQFRNLKLFNDAIDGISAKQGVYIFSGSSGSAKTTLTLNVSLGLIEGGDKVIFISNEMTSAYAKEILVSYICTVVFKCYSINRKKIAHMDLTEEEYKVFFQANNFIKEKYKDSLRFISVSEFDVEKITKIAKRLNLAEGYNVLVCETFKSSDGADDTVQDMINNSRLLDKFGKQNNMKIILPAQTRTADEGVISYVTSASLSGSKGIKEVAHTITILRKVRKDELDESNKKMYIKPFKWAKDDVTGKYYKKYLKFKKDEEEKTKRSGRLSRNKDEEVNNDEYLDPNAVYRLMFIDKCRSSEDTDKVLLMKLDGAHGICSFVALVDHVYAGRLNGY